MSPNGRIQTSCEKCIFAQYTPATRQCDLPLARYVQTGCDLGRIEKFVALGTRMGRKIIENGNDSYDTYVIDRVCTAARGPEWAADKPEGSQVKLVREELKELTRAQVYIVVRANDDIEDVFKTVDSLIKQTTSPVCVRLILSDNLKPTPFIRRLHASPLKKWEVTQAVSNDQGVFPGVWGCIDLAAHQCRALLYVQFRPGFIVPPDFLASIDRAINDDLKPFVAIQGDLDGNGETVLLRIHHLLGGNAETDMVNGDPDKMSEEELANLPTTPVAGVLNKIAFLAKMTNTPGLILEAKDL